jgi:hypothetical protein
MQQPARKTQFDIQRSCLISAENSRSMVWRIVFQTDLRAHEQIPCRGPLGLLLQQLQGDVLGLRRAEEFAVASPRL